MPKLKSCVAFQPFLINKIPILFFGESHGTVDATAVKLLDHETGSGVLIKDILPNYEMRVALFAETMEASFTKDSEKYKRGGNKQSTLTDIQRYQSKWHYKNLKFVNTDPHMVFMCYIGAHVAQCRDAHMAEQIFTRYFDIFDYIFYNTGREKFAHVNRLAFTKLLQFLRKIVAELPSNILNSIIHLYNKIKKDGLHMLDGMLEGIKNRFQFVPVVQCEFAYHYKSAHVSEFINLVVLHFTMFLRDLNPILYLFKSLTKKRYDCYIFWYGAYHLWNFSFLIGKLAKYNKSISFVDLERKEKPNFTCKQKGQFLPMPLLDWKPIKNRIDKVLRPRLKRNRSAVNVVKIGKHKKVKTLTKKKTKKVKRLAKKKTAS